jgi:hypothetical protein
MLLNIMAYQSRQHTFRHYTSCKNTPSPGIYAVITLPLLNRTLATFLSPELGFFGFVVPTRRHTPFISGLFTNAGDVGFRARCSTLHPRRTWLYVAWRDGALEKDRTGRFVMGEIIALKQLRVVEGSRSIVVSILDAIVVVVVFWDRTPRSHSHSVEKAKRTGSPVWAV